MNLSRTSFLYALPASLAFLPFSVDGANFTSTAAGGAWNTPGAWTTVPGPNGPRIGDGTDNATIVAGSTVTYTNPIDTGGAVNTDWNVGGGSSVLVDGGTLHHNGSNNWSKIGSNTGSGNVTIQNGGTYDIDGGDLAIGVDGGDGTLTVTGAGSTYNHDVNDIRVGWDNSNGTLNLADGAALTHNPGNWMFVANGQNSNGTVNITGAGTSLITNADRTIVGDQGTSVGVINQSDGTASYGADGGDFFLGNFGTGTYNLTGGTVTTSDNVNIGVEPGSNGIFNISGATASLTIDNDIRIGANGTGVMNVNMGGTVTNAVGGWTFIGSDAGTGTLNVADAGTNYTTSDERSYIGFNGTGTHNHTGGTATYNADPNIAGFTLLADGANSSGTINIDFGRINIGDQTNTDDNLAFGGGTAAINQSGGTILVENNFELSSTGGNGVVTFSGGTFDIGNDVIDRDGSTLFGVSGTAVLLAENILFNAGDGNDTFEVSGSMQSITIGTNLDVLNGDTFSFILDGTADAFNPLTVGGDLNLAGGLGAFDVSAWGNGWVPFGTEIPLVDITGAGSNGIGGIFDNFGELSVVGASGPVTFQLSRLGGDGNDLVLIAVPEPTRGLLLALGLGGLLLRRRRS